MAQAAWLEPWGDWAQANLGLVIAVLGGGLVLLLLLLLGQSSALGAMRRHYLSLADGRDGRNLHELLDHHLARIGAAEGQLAELSRRLEALAAHEAGALKYTGLVRYDAFDNVGGMVSFALAVIDDHRDGFILNNLFGRDGSSTYAKPVHAGRSDIALSDEEQEALKQAVEAVGSRQ